MFEKASLAQDNGAFVRTGGHQAVQMKNAYPLFIAHQAYPIGDLIKAKRFDVIAQTVTHFVSLTKAPFQLIIEVGGDDLYPTPQRQAELANGPCEATGWNWFGGFTVKSRTNKIRL